MKRRDQLRRPNMSSRLDWNAWLASARHGGVVLDEKELRALFDLGRTPSEALEVQFEQVRNDTQTVENMPARIPIAAAKDVANKYACHQVIIMAWDGERTHCVTYGKTVEDCDQAAQGGNRVKDALGWPESLMAEPRRVQKLKARVAQLEARLGELP